jgi:hypothetical protein
MRRHKPLLPFALLSLLLAACSADPLNIVVLGARAPGDKCDFSDNTKYVEGGSVDFRPYVDPSTGAIVSTGSYGQIFGWENNLQRVPLSVNGDVVDNGSGNDFIADSVVYEYQYTDPSVTLATELQNIHATIAAQGDDEDNTVGISLIQPGASAAIGASTLIDTVPQTLLVTFQIFGKLVAGQPKFSNKVSFPVTVYRTGLTCNAGGCTITTLDCGAGGGGLVINAGPCGIPGRDQVISCTKP